jgi:hypothetical protein
MALFPTPWPLVGGVVLVFGGVYAAFWLNNYQQQQHDANRHDQILVSLEEQLKEGIDSARTEGGAKQDKQAAEFRRALDAGEMPPTHPFAFVSD